MERELVDRGLAELEVPWLTSPEGAAMLYDFVLGSEVVEVLELGFAHGMSTAYLAAALHEKGGGRVTTIDRQTAREREPNIHRVLEHLGLESFVEPVFATRSYTWELMRLVERRSVDGPAEPCFDFCFIDGAHTWDADGLAFFLVDKLLRDDRWVVFDDLHWTAATSPSQEEGKGVDAPAEERTTAQIALVFDLLVRQHPAYESFRMIGDYGWAYKRGAGRSDANADAVDRLLAPKLLKQLALGLRHSR